ncbi:MAG: GtrA family protein, partial [Alphaproteobacteria bacterium]|nr:GtrA family protein [Alphaproteobacteria bacterium]
MLDKYKDIVAYLFFGVCTTVVNVLTYWFCAYVLHLNTIVATSIAWVFAVAFAYITNRLWVFRSNAKTRKEIFREICSFTACRLLTGFLDIAIMYVFVDRLNCPDVIVKIISN